MVFCGIAVVVIAYMHMTPDQCSKEPTLPYWLNGHGTLSIVIGCSLIARLNFSTYEMGPSAIFFKWLLFTITTMWVSCGTATQIMLTAQQNITKVDCDPLMLYALGISSGLFWIGIVLFVIMSIIRRQQTHAVKSSGLHLAPVRKSLFGDFVTRNNIYNEPKYLTSNARPSQTL
ncbi:uncharacterized protein LOC142355687 isoform X1 [Convolutriloba macropyga]|uniref:uncharacterized protein LOC142355687 isoform X1 n=1 Tax=Convolutriloba macropyga TaxID=536237 RepID=UPI003F5238BB